MCTRYSHLIWNSVSLGQALSDDITDLLTLTLAWGMCVTNTPFLSETHTHTIKGMHTDTHPQTEHTHVHAHTLFVCRLLYTCILIKYVLSKSFCKSYKPCAKSCTIFHHHLLCCQINIVWNTLIMQIADPIVYKRVKNFSKIWINFMDF